MNVGEDRFQVIIARFDQLEAKMEALIGNILDEINDGHKPKNLPLNEFFSTFCTLKAWNEKHPSAIVYKASLGLFLKFMSKKYPNVKNLRELTPIMVSEYVRYLKDKRIYSKRRNQWESLSERTINEHIKKLRHALEIVDSVGLRSLGNV